MTSSLHWFFDQWLTNNPNPGNTTPHKEQLWLRRCSVLCFIKYFDGNY